MKFLILSYDVTCILFAIYYSIGQAERYFKNEDASTITFRMFNERSDDYYPDVTFCFNGGHLKEATEELPISQHGVSEILKGNADIEERVPKSFEAIATSNTDAYLSLIHI